jgi:uncharacterized protein (DUF1499 family)
MANSDITALSLLGIALSACLTGCSGARPAGLGATDGKLAPCPASPNCVSSQSADREHAVAPMRYAVPTPRAMADLRNVVTGMKRAKIVDVQDGYIHAEFTSALWRFVDDVEFYFDDAAKVIQVRSASRLGTYDFGVNRKRVEEIRARWTALRK